MSKTIAEKGDRHADFVERFGNDVFLLLYLRFKQEKTLRSC
jgi:hypothetical protein